MNTKGAVGDISNDERPNHASDTRIKRRSITLTHKAELKPLTREPKKSVLEPELKNI
ncbi:hypothetical protein [Helicobacter pylori]|uniref:hypothetical protein n=1 Tax=Helicobacter pylori TaxID=210 RepID=UPI001FD15407|nr:hypothetical protein [Helicobacter pylori]UOS68955.1 hypothetical protein MPG20_00390 [Helicobacter pylori]